MQTHKATRRSFLGRAAAGGAVLTLGSTLVPVTRFLPAAWADVAPDDVELVKFAAGLELAAVEIYELALDGGSLSGGAQSVANMFAGHHRQHAETLNTALGEEEAVTKADPAILRQFRSRVTGAENEAAVLQAAYLLEEVAASTHLLAVGTLSDKRNAATVSTILPVESQHAVVLASFLEKDPEEYLIEFLTTDQAAEPA